MTYQEKIQKAKAGLMLDHPYFGTIASALTLEKSDTVESFLSDGNSLQFNDEYFDVVGVEEVEFALANGAMHTQQYPNFEIDLITVDARIQSHEVFLPGEALVYEIKGGGGTDFRPVFEYIDRYIDHPTLLIYFTDGLGTFPSQEPNYDLLWVMPESQDVPFGEVMLIERK